jgi:hypothetical protein
MTHGRRGGPAFRADGTDPNVDQRVISAGYFDAMGISVLAGRVFREGDAYLDGTPVVISKSMALLLWPTAAIRSVTACAPGHTRPG